MIRENRRPEVAHPNLLFQTNEAIGQKGNCDE
jgi:hypothetical protein